MSIDLSPKALESAEALIAQGRFSSIQEAVGAALENLLVEEHTLQWSSELQTHIDEGVAAFNRGEFATEAEMDLLFAAYRPESA